MATQKIDPLHLETLPAASDLSAKQFFLCKITTAGKVDLAGAGDIAFSIQEGAKQGNGVTFATGDRPKAVAGGSIEPGQLLSAGASGKIVAATATVLEAEKVKTQGSRVIGIALDGAVSGELVPYIATPYGGRA